LNTLVNFESALLGLGGQFSVGGNKQIEKGCFDCSEIYEKTSKNL